MTFIGNFEISLRDQGINNSFVLPTLFLVQCHWNSPLGYSKYKLWPKGSLGSQGILKSGLGQGQNFRP